MTDDNVIQFPLSLERTKELSLDFQNQEAQTATGSIYLNKVAFVDELLESTTVPLLNQYASHGIDIKDKKFQVDFRYAIDCMKSAIYRQLGLNHPIQDVMDFVDIED
tara:strand:+ start:159 stop:479 length:321 start_codon:yes stop_codon:yes gene_type:complete